MSRSIAGRVSARPPHLTCFAGGGVCSLTHTHIQEAHAPPACALSVHVSRRRPSRSRPHCSMPPTHTHTSRQPPLPDRKPSSRLTHTTDQGVCVWVFVFLLLFHWWEQSCVGGDLIVLPRIACFKRVLSQGDCACVMPLPQKIGGGGGGSSWQRGSGHPVQVSAGVCTARARLAQRRRRPCGCPPPLGCWPPAQ